MLTPEDETQREPLGLKYKARIGQVHLLVDWRNIQLKIRHVDMVVPLNEQIYIPSRARWIIQNIFKAETIHVSLVLSCRGYQSDLVVGVISLPSNSIEEDPVPDVPPEIAVAMDMMRKTRQRRANYHHDMHWAKEPTRPLTPTPQRRLKRRHKPYAARPQSNNMPTIHINKPKGGFPIPKKTLKLNEPDIMDTNWDPVIAHKSVNVNIPLTPAQDISPSFSSLPSLTKSCDRLDGNDYVTDEDETVNSRLNELD